MCQDIQALYRWKLGCGELLTRELVWLANETRTVGEVNAHRSCRNSSQVGNRTALRERHIQVSDHFQAGNLCKVQLIIMSRTPRMVVVARLAERVVEAAHDERRTRCCIACARTSHQCCFLGSRELWKPRHFGAVERFRHEIRKRIQCVDVRHTCVSSFDMWLSGWFSVAAMPARLSQPLSLLYTLACILSSVLR